MSDPYICRRCAETAEECDACEFRRAWDDCKREFWKVVEPPLLRLNGWLERLAATAATKNE